MHLRERLLIASLFALCLSLPGGTGAGSPAKQAMAAKAQVPGEKSCCTRADLLEQAVEKLKQANDQLAQENQNLKREIAECKAKKGKQ